MTLVYKVHEKRGNTFFSPSNTHMSGRYSYSAIWKTKSIQTCPYSEKNSGNMNNDTIDIKTGCDKYIAKGPYPLGLFAVGRLQ